VEQVREKRLARVQRVVVPADRDREVLAWRVPELAICSDIGMWPSTVPVASVKSPSNR